MVDEVCTRGCVYKEQRKGVESEVSKTGFVGAALAEGDAGGPLWSLSPGPWEKEGMGPQEPLLLLSLCS